MDRHLEDIREIRTLMERSSRFISLSGLSGVSAGVVAVAGAAVAYYLKDYFATKTGGLILFYVIDALIVLTLAILSGFYFTYRKTKRGGHKLIDKTSMNMLINLFIPIVTGGIFCIASLYHGLVGLIAPSMLIFYGLGLINASRYSLHTIRYLGYLQLVLGIINLFVIGYGLIFWVVGFGLLHIIYGIFMYRKYDRQ
ncbi:MAG: hypothetical protein N4A72_02585 [Bacteroidales bacterium]|jgi:hypothetical protein|nr:hypothetical protein [Bacteroidales bacterium]